MTSASSNIQASVLRALRRRPVIHPQLTKDHDEWKTAEQTIASSMQIGRPAVGRLRDLVKGGLQGCLKSIGCRGAAAPVPAIGFASFSNGGWVKINLGRNHPGPRRSFASPRSMGSA